MAVSICAVYRSRKKSEMYLYVPVRDKFEQVPKALLDQFGQPELVMMLSFSAKQQLARVDIDKVQQALQEQGFYLQMPPPVENLLTTHLTQTKGTK
jgi:uncharacterized protein YcgL (UPF0745 family)